MKTTNIILLIFSIFFISCNTEQIKQNEQLKSELEKINKNLISLKIHTGRYKIVQSTITARGTYKIDTYTGDIYQLVVNNEDENLWQSMDKYGHSNNDPKIEGQKNYELFNSTISVKFTFLINVNSGATWQLFRDTESGDNFFSSIE